MADINKTIEIVFGAKDDASAVFTTLGAELGRLDQSVQSIAAPFASFTNNLLALDAGLIAVAATMTGVSVASAGAFKGSIAEIGTLFNATSQQSDELGQAILDFSRTSVSSLDDINEATYIAISTGTEWAEVTETLAISEQLAATAGVSLTESTSALSRTMNAYGAEASDAQRFSDALFVTVQNGDTTLAQLAASLGQVTAVAAAADVDIETLGSALATLTVAGVSTAESTTRLNALFRELLNPSKKLEIAFGGMSLESNTLQEIMQQLQGVTGGSAKEMNNLFGSSEAAQAAIILANDASGTFVNTLTAMEDKTGTVAANYDAMAQSFTNANQNLANNLRATFIDFGLPLLDEYGNAVSGLGAIFQSISFSFKGGAFDEVYQILEQFFDRIGNTVNAVAGSLSGAFDLVDFSGLAKELEDLGAALYDAFVRVFGEIDPNDSVQVAAGIQKAVNLLTQLVAATKGIIDFFDPIFSSLGEAAKEISALNPEVSAAAGSFLAAMTAISALGTAFGSVAIALKAAGTDIKAVFDVILGSGQLIFNGLQLVFDGIVRGAASMAQAVLEYLRNMFPAFLFPETAAKFDVIIKSLDAFGEAVQESAINNSFEAQSGFDRIALGLKNVGNETDKVNPKIKTTGDAIEKVGKTSETAGSGFEKIIDPLERLALGQGGLSGVLDVTTGKIKTQTEGVSFLTKEFIDSGDIIGDYNLAVATTERHHGTLFKVIVDAKTGLKTYSQVVDATAQSLDKQTEKTDKVTESTENFKIEMEKIASNERIKNIEAKISLDIANVEANAQIVTAAFESIDTGIESTGKLIGDLFGVLLDANSWAQRRLIEEQLQKENDRRDQAFKLQKELTEAEINLIKEKTRRLAKGDALIKIDGDGLQPQLEAFMWEVLNAIQVRANAEGSEFLLGVA